MCLKCLIKKHKTGECNRNKDKTFKKKSKPHLEDILSINKCNDFVNKLKMCDIWISLNEELIV